jgi:hypothetical protein
MMRKAAAQHDRDRTVNHRQAVRLGLHVAFLEEKGLLNEFNEWQQGRVV